PENVNCWSCDGVETYTTTCRNAFGTLCETCEVQTVFADNAEQIDDWPCLPEGQFCPEEAEGLAFCRSDGRQFDCLNGRWTERFSDVDCENFCEG
ncbi:MAG: hypothetical protein AAFV29_17715, partial [Myxococcota bacterium]